MGQLGFRFHCSFCDEALNDQGYKLIGYDELKLVSAHYYRLCSNCWREIDGALRQTLVRIRIAKLHEIWGSAKQDMSVGEIGKQP